MVVFALLCSVGFETTACDVPFFQVAEEMLPFEHCVMYFYDGNSTTKDQVTALIKRESRKWSDEHAVFYFYDSRTSSKDAVDKLVRSQTAAWAEVVNAVFSAVDISKDDRQAMAKAYRVDEVPMTVILSPENAVLARLKGLAGGDKLKKVFRQPAKTANVVFTAVDASKDYQKFILKHYQVERGPVTLIVSPEDTVITRIPGLATADRLKDVFTSPAKRKIAKELVKNKVVYLLFRNKKTKHGKEMSKVVKETQSLLKEFGWCTAGVVPIDPKDKKEEFLLKNLEISGELEEATLMVVFGSGFVVRAKLTWKITSDELLGIVQVLAGPCLCTMSPEMIVGNTLLMVQEKQEKKKG